MVERAFFDNLVGTAIGRYRLEQVLETTAWGPIFLARGATEQLVAAPYVVHLLQIAEKIPQDARIVYLGRFQQEANRIASLQHPAILSLLDYGNMNGIPYLIYPQLKGTVLRQAIAQQRPLPLATISRYLEQMVSALSYAHQHMVLHRNLSTSNIVLTQQQQAVITNFGVLHLIELSRQAAQPGTPPTYEGSSESSAPEQLSGQAVSAATDIYALGVVLYRMLTGRMPFTAQRREEMVQQHLSASVPSISTYRPDAPIALDSVIARAMAKEPTQRFSTPDEFLAAYQRIVAPSAATRSQQSGPIATPPLVAPTQAVGGNRGNKSVPLVAPLRQTRTAPPASFTRRRLFTVLAAGGGVAAAAAIVVFGSHLFNLMPGTNATGTTTGTGSASGSAGTQATKPVAQSQNVLARTSDIPINSAKKFPIKGQQNPGVIVHLADNNFVAFDSTCTHEGCPVDYSAQTKLLVCPCHDAIFDPAKNADVVQGPAPTPLAPIKITVNADGTITSA